ncbi:diguanylate cyclase [Paucibacter sp. R3-3]|uniref:Diguanylate cyclase n=1 Tax=Roseateles agri TaxID=3098619 RepID=A0ABU5DBX4_9BURK|nr:diguanylate cyclase [Paucibacter sp. R3-3]MDY0743767.1 diguanylate cyclase [Paucibacter sp. R3-3]
MMATLFGSLKLRIALMAVSVIALSVGMTVFLVTRDTALRAESSIKDSALDVDTVASTISSRLLNREQALARVAMQWPRTAAAPDRAVARAFLKQQAVLGVLFPHAFVAAARDGRVLAAVGDDDATVAALEGRSLLSRSYFRQAVSGRELSVSEIMDDGGSTAGELHVVLAVPLRDAAGKVVAVLGGVLRPQTDTVLTDSTRASSLSQDPIETIITDAAGRIVSHPDPAWLRHDVGEDPRLAAAAARWRSEGSPMEAQAWTWRTGDQFVAMAAVPEGNWMVFRVASADLLLGGPARGRAEAIWLGALVAIAGATLMLLATIWLLRPMRLLERRARRLLDESLPIDAGWPVGSGEIGRLSAVFRQVLVERAAVQRDGRQMLARLRAVMRNAPVGIAISRQGRVELASGRLGELLGYTEAELVGAPQQIIFPGGPGSEELMAQADAALAAGQLFSDEVQLQRRDGRRFWAALQGAAVNAGTPEAGVIWLVADISSQRQHREQLSWSATHDPLTELVNRREFEARMHALLNDRRRHGPASALFIDLDGFKAVNDSAGHAAGDAMLQHVATLLGSRVRDGDTVARLGGDEFAVLLAGCDRATAEAVAEQIRSRIAAFRLPWRDLTLQVGASIGVVEMDDSLPDIAAVMAAADAACYEAKRAGRNRVRSHRPEGAAVH